MLADVPTQRFDAYLDAERRSGERYLGDTGRIQWIVSFAPIAPAELRAFARASPHRGAKRRPDRRAGRWPGPGPGRVRGDGFESFNCAIYGAPPGTEGYPLNLRLACRSNLKPFYRSDSTFLERLHWEGAVDLAPETVAQRIGGRFRG